MRKVGQSNTNTFILLLPWLICFGIFWLYPLFYAGYLSFTDYKSLTDEKFFVGLDNYIKMFGDRIFLKALTNTLIFTIGTVPLTCIGALILAAVINSKTVKFKEFFRASYFAPSVTSLVVVSLIFTNLYSKDGYINSLMSMLGTAGPDKGWLLEPSTSLLSIMAMDIWISIGYYMVLFLAGMQTIPSDLYDAAKLAGAGPWRRFKSITVPMLRSTLLFVIVINTIKSFQIFIEIYVMTKGGPLDSTTTIVYLIFSNAFEKTDMMGYAAAMAYLLFFMLIILSLVQAKLLKNK